MFYKPGMHIVATLETEDETLLTEFAAVKDLINDLIETHHLQKLGEVYHNFSPAGFTGVVCLSESHVSIHTWPEFKKINLDIYLSNFQKNNDGTVDSIYRSFVAFFNATILSETFIRR
jgi:S-adenosylmethionine decarboxylase